MARSGKLCESDRINIIELYGNGLTTGDLSKKYDVTRSAISSLLRKRGVSIREQSLATRKFNIFDGAFNDLSNDEVMYWLGFLMADGNLFKLGNSYRITLGLQKKDLNHLLKFKRFLHSERKICEYKNSYVFVVNSKKLGERLNMLGIIPNKSHINNKIDLRLLRNRHFWRGMIDGDGHLGIYGYKATLQLAGKRQILDYFVHYIGVQFPQIDNSLSPHGTTFQISYWCNTAIHLISHFYDRYSIALERKRTMAMNILNMDLQLKFFDERRFSNAC